MSFSIRPFHGEPPTVGAVREVSLGKTLKNEAQKGELKTTKKAGRLITTPHG